MNIVDKAKAKRKEMDEAKGKAKKADDLTVELGTVKGKSDKLGKAVRKLTQAEFDALPKALQKELKEFR